MTKNSRSKNANATIPTMPHSRSIFLKNSAFPLSVLTTKTTIHTKIAAIIWLLVRDKTSARIPAFIAAFQNCFFPAVNISKHPVIKNKKSGRHRASLITELGIKIRSTEKYLVKRYGIIPNRTTSISSHKSKENFLYKYSAKNHMLTAASTFCITPAA